MKRRVLCGFVLETRLCACRCSSLERGTCKAAGWIPNSSCTCNAYIYFLNTYRHQGKISVPASSPSPSPRMLQSPIPTFFSSMSNCSPPLNIVNLSPLPKKSQRLPSYHSLSTTSVLFSTPSTPSSLPTHTVGLTKARPSFPPPSAYIDHRRERSKEILQHLTVLAPGREGYVQYEAQIQDRHRNRQGAGEKSTTGRSMRMERGPKPVSEMSTNGHAPASVPQQKKGFFRRLSLASGGINSTAQVQPSNKLGKRNKDKETQVQGQAYEQLDVGPAPSGNKIAEDMKRTKSKDRGFWSRGDKGESDFVCAMKNILKEYIGTTPTHLLPTSPPSRHFNPL